MHNCSQPKVFGEMAVVFACVRVVDAERYVSGADCLVARRMDG